MATVCGLPQPQLRTEACTRWLGAVAGFRGTVGGRAGGFPSGSTSLGWLRASHSGLWAGARRRSPCAEAVLCATFSPGCGASKKGALGTAPGQKQAPAPTPRCRAGGVGRGQGAAIVSPLDASLAVWRRKCQPCGVLPRSHPQPGHLL